MIYETLQDFPAGIGQTDVTLRAVNVVGLQENPYSLAREVQMFPGARWELEISIIPSVRAEAQKLEAFLLSLRGRAGMFRLADPYASLPLGSASGSPYVISGSAGDEVLQTGGWPGMRAGLLLAGDFVETDTHLHRVLADVSSDAAGKASISLWPPLRDNAIPYTALVVKNARGVFALDSNSIEFGRTVDGLNTATLRAVEVVSSRPMPVVQRVAMMGDSMTGQGALGLNELSAYGAVVQARARSGSRFDFVPNGGDLFFAASGLRADQIEAAYLPLVLASNAQACVFMAGANDAIQATSAASFVASIVRMAKALKTKGIVPVFLAPPPMPLALSGNSAGIYSSFLAAYWAALAPALAAINCLYIPCPAELEAVPGNRDGIGNSAYFSDNLHPNYVGMASYGRILAQEIKKRFRLPLDPYNMGGTWISSNWQLIGSGGQPSGWNAPTIPSGATLNSKKLTPLGDGTYAWDIDYSQGTSVGNGALQWSAPQPNQDGKTVDGIITVQVLSGSFDFTKFANFVYGGTTGTGFDMRNTAGVILGKTMFPSDGEVILRTPKTTVGPSSWAVGPLLEFAGTGVLRIKAAGARSYP